MLNGRPLHDHSFVCSQHFTDDSIEVDSALASQFGLKKRRRLKVSQQYSIDHHLGLNRSRNWCTYKLSLGCRYNYIAGVHFNAIQKQAVTKKGDERYDNYCVPKIQEGWLYIVQKSNIIIIMVGVIYMYTRMLVYLQGTSWINEGWWTCFGAEQL